MINFSFVVLFHNNSHTEYVIDAILKQIIPGDEIIVVDDNSEKENLKKFDKFANKITLLHSDRKGSRAYNRNFGAKCAKNDYLFFVDGDIILLPYSIMAMRMSLMQGFIGVVGNVIRGNNTPNQMKLLTGTDYMSLFNSDMDIRSFIDLSLTEDRRQRYVFDKIATSCLWEYFFTAYCAVNKAKFEQIGGFDTQFKGWGVEDDEFGFRLNKVGKIEYNNAAYGVHVPHPRDLYKCLLSNRINLYRFLAKSPCNELEIHMSFGNSIKAQYSFEFIKKSLIEANTEVFDFPKHNNCIYINELTSKYPCGYIEFIAPNGEQHILELLGLALPFKNKNFDCAYMSENILIYPEFFASLIIAEALRVAKKVCIVKIKNPKRIKWREDQINELTRISTSGRIVYNAMGLCDFDIEDCGQYYKIEKGFVSKLNDHFEITENFYMPELFKKSLKRYIVLNLSGEPISQKFIKKSENEHGIIIFDVYDIKMKFASDKIKLSEQLVGDLHRLHTPIAYFLPKNKYIDKNDSWWESEYRENDLVIQNS